MAGKNVSEITYFVLGGTLNLNSINHADGSHGGRVFFAVCLCVCFNNNNNNIHICIAPYGRNFRGAVYSFPA